MKSSRLIFILIFTVIIFSCGIKPNSWEREGVIAVMADSTDWKRLHPDLSTVFERVIRTPQRETTFILRYVKEDEFMRYTKYRYLILAATLESKGKIGEIVNKVVADPKVRAEVESGQRFLIVEKNQWAHKQILLILIGKDIVSLQNILYANSSVIYNSIDDIYNERMLKSIFRKKEQKEIEKRLMSTYNWSLRVQHDYFIPQELPEEGFLWFRRVLPERWIFVRWIDGGDKSLLNAKWIIGERNRIGAMYYGGDTVVSEYLFSYRSNFLGRPAQVTTGLWKNKEKVAGGPFKSYTFFDKYTKRVYMIDIAVYAPGRDKIPYLRRLDLITRSFKTVFDMEID